MISQKDALALACLRRNSRQSLTSISKETRIPVSTLFDKLKSFEKHFVHKHTCLVDFGKMGFQTRACVLLKAELESRDSIREMLDKELCVNNVYKVNSGYDFMCEVVHRDLKALEDFLERLESSHNLKSTDVIYLIEDIKRESFLSDPHKAAITVR